MDAREAITIDGSMGEGGGQILRTALALAIITGTPVRFERVRAGRAKPGLMRQHLTAVLAAKDISNAEVEGARIGSLSLSFRPGALKPGLHRWSVGTAGSATLVLQTVLPALITAGTASKLQLEGGTHNPTAPPFDFISKTFLPLLAEMGAKVGIRLFRPGFYPAGGGRFEVDVEPVAKLGTLELNDRGPIQERRAIAVVSDLPESIAERELQVVQAELGIPRSACRREVLEGFGPGNLITIELESRRLVEVVTAFGRKGVRAEAVAAEAVEEARRYLDAEAPVGPHLADQLLLPLSLAGSGSFTTQPLSEHTRTQIALIPRFLPVSIRTEEVDSGSTAGPAQVRVVVSRP
jgi:RNA 3'-terminal phosphate cyclase (ATP)